MSKYRPCQSFRTRVSHRSGSALRQTHSLPHPSSRARRHLPVDSPAIATLHPYAREAEARLCSSVRSVLERRKPLNQRPFESLMRGVLPYEGLLKFPSVPASYSNNSGPIPVVLNVRQLTLRYLGRHSQHTASHQSVLPQHLPRISLASRWWLPRLASEHRMTLISTFVATFVRDEAAAPRNLSSSPEVT